MVQDGERVLMGWFTTRWVKADSSDNAEILVLDQLWSDPAIEHNPDGSTARIVVEDVEELEEREISDANIGFTFFRMDN